MEAYLFEIEKDGVEAEEHEGDSGSKPAKLLVLESLGVNPNIQLLPRLGRARTSLWVGNGKEEREQSGQADEACNTADCIVEPNLGDEEAQHDRVDKTRCIRH